MSCVAVPEAAIAGIYNTGEMPETAMVHFARNFVVDLANYTWHRRRKVISPRLAA